MEREQFASILRNEGFAEGIVVDRESNGFLDFHEHPFEAKALILSGEFSLRIGDAEQRYQPGQVFHLPANTLHSERYGPVGVRYLVGRK